MADEGSRRPPTIYDVAERAGVSKSLVSLVLSGSPRVSDARREAVLSAVDELDYTPSRLAAGLAGAKTRSIGVVIDEFENLWFAAALAGLRDGLGDTGYRLSVADSALNTHLGQDAVDAFRALRVDGVVLAGEVSEASALRLTVPTVVLGLRELTLPGAAVVANDEEAGGRLATAHLAELGHRRIACVSAGTASAVARERGYLAELAARGLRPRLIRADRTTETSARTAAAALFEGVAVADRPTAVFGVNDPMAVGVMGAARERGLEVPRDLSVVGYDDSPIASYGLLSLTSVSGELHRLGEAAGRTLLEMIRGAGEAGAGEAGAGDAGAAGTARYFEPRLVVRGSTAPVSTRGSRGGAF